MLTLYDKNHGGSAENKQNLCNHGAYILLRKAENELIISMKSFNSLIINKCRNVHFFWTEMID